MKNYTLEEYIKMLGKITEELRNSVTEVLEGVWAEDMAARIQDRVEDKRLTADGGSFSSYDPKYLKWKQKKGFIGSKKNFALTREMWSRFGGVKTTKKKEYSETRLGGKNKASQLKINVNSKREDRSIIEANKKEHEAQNKFFEKWLNDFLSKRL